MKKLANDRRLWLAAFSFFSLGEGYMTITLLSQQIAEELNPLIRWFYSIEPALVLVVKLLGVGIIWLFVNDETWKQKSTRVVIKLGACFYAALLYIYVATLIAEHMK